MQTTRLLNGNLQSVVGWSCEAISDQIYIIVNCLQVECQISGCHFKTPRSASQVGQVYTSEDTGFDSARFMIFRWHLESFAYCIRNKFTSSIFGNVLLRVSVAQ